MNFLKQGLIEEDRKLKEKMKQEVQRNLPKNYGTPPAPIVKTYPPKTVPQNYGTLPTTPTNTNIPFFATAPPSAIEKIQQQTISPPIKPVQNYGTLPKTSPFMMAQPTGADLINQQIDTGTLPNLPKKQGISTGRVGQFLEGINKGGIGGIMNLVETAEKDLNYRMYNKALEAGYPKAAEKYKKRLDDITNNSVSAPLIERGQQATLKAKEGLGGVGSTLVDVGTSIGNNLQAIGAGMVTGINPLAIMAFQSGGQSAYEAAQKGATPSQQLTKGIVSGAIEAATEKLPLEGLTRLVKEGGKAGVKQLLKRLLQQGLTEAAEEAVSYIANNAAGKVILGDLEDDFDLKELGYSALLGGISGGVMGGGAATLGTITQANYQKAGGDDVWGDISEWQRNTQFGQQATQNYGTLPPKSYGTVPTETPQATQNYGTLPPKNYGTVPNAVNLPPKQAVQAETQQSRVNVPMQQETGVQGQEIIINKATNKPVSQHGAIPPGENPVRNVDVPVKSADGRNVRRLSRTVMEAEIMPNEMVSDLEKEIASGRMSYDVISDKSAEDYANRVIKENGFNGALQFWDNIINGNGRIDKNTFALGQVLLNQAMTNGDTTLAMKLISELGVASTIGGQITQANRMIKKMTPDGRLYHLEVTVKKINQELADKKGDKAPTIKIDENLAKDLLNSQTQEEVEANSERIEQDIADQLDVTLGEKLENWRYTGMLGSIKTHVRNIIGNASMYVNKQIKDKIGAVMEKALPKSKRTKSFTTNKADRAFAEADFNEFSDAISGEGKYNTKQGIMSKRVIYKTRALEWLRNTNSKFLEMEDVFFLKANYISSFAQAMKARGLTAEFLKSGTPESNQQLAELREYATNEAQRATFRDASALANALSRLEKSGKGGAFLVKGLMPFKKVPINVLKRGVGYSPVGIIKGTYDTLVSVRNGTKTATQAIDTLSAGLTGTGIMALGAFLASAGLIVGGKDDDDRYQSFEALQGSQNYAIKFMGKTYTIDWLAPTSIPLMAGVELFNDLKNSEGFTITKFFDSLSKISEPAFELSTLQGLNNTIKSAMYNPDNPLSSMLARIAQNYVGQFFPTILGQAARTIDENRRSVYVDKNAPIPAFIQETSQRLMSKIPGASFPLSPMVDLWGRELKGEENVALRAFENFISPGYLEGDKATALDREIDRLYKKTGNKSVIPRKADKYFQVDGKRLDLTQGQYYRYAKAKGQMSYEYADKIRKNPAYAKLSDAEKSDVISSAYEYANARAKTQVSDYKLDGWHAKAEKAGIMIDDYLILRAMLPENPKKAEVSATANKISPQKAPKLVELYYSKLDKD